MYVFGFSEESIIFGILRAPDFADDLNIGLTLMRITSYKVLEEKFDETRTTLYTDVLCIFECII